MESFGKYQLIRRIGAGGMAEVFLARTAVAQGLSKELVLKKIHPDYARSRRFLSMFVAEAKIALGLNHPNIVQVFDFGTADGTFFLAMEYIEGLDLLRMLEAASAAGAGVPLEISAFVVQEVARGLDYAHRKTDAFGAPLGIVHRDVSLQNILVSWDGAVKIVDFGVARARGVAEAPGAVKGKLRYMSPEQARGEEVDGRADVFSAGVVLFELCCGRPLYSGTGDEVLTQVRSGAIVRPREVNPAIPESLESILLEALAFHPDDRFQSARALQVALGRFLLDRAQHSGSLTDAAALAQFLDSIVPPAERAAQPGGERAAGAAPAETRPAGLGPADEPLTLADSITTVGERPPVRGDTHPNTTRMRAHKHVLLLSGRLSADRVAPAPDAPEGSGEVAARDAAHSAPAPDAPEGGGEVAARDAAHSAPAHSAKYARGEVAARDAAGAPRERGTRDEACDRERWDAELVGVVSDIAFKYEARVTRAGADGLELIVGVPASADDDATRTVQLALALVEAVDALGRERGVDERLAVGIQRGLAVLSEPTGDGSTGRATSESDLIELLPGTTEMARRLAERARGGEILVSGGVHQMARSEWHFDELGELAIAAEADADAAARPDGADEIRTRVYRLRAPKGRRERLRELTRSRGLVIGRELEQKALRDAYRDVLIRRGKRNLLLAGEVGVGKRALISAFVHGLPPGEALVLRAITRLSAAYTPYALLADLTRDMLRLDEGAPPAQVQERLERLVRHLYPSSADQREARRVADTLYLLLAGTDRPLAPTEGSGAYLIDDAIDADERRQRIWQAIVRVEQRLAPDTPLVVILEDAHWSDDESLTMVRDLLAMPSPRPLLGLITSRPDARVASVAASLEADIVRVEALDLETAMTLVTQRFTPDQDVRELARQIVSRTGGYPFFIIEVLHSLRERGVVREEEGGLLRWVDRAAPLGVPSSVEAFLAARIDGLPAGEKEALLCAAVLGRACLPEVLAHLLGRAADAELEALDERGLLIQRDGLHAFASDMLMSVAYGLVPAAERTRLHRRAAERLRAPERYRPGHDDALIARHLELAGDAAGAADAYLRAAVHAARVGGNGDALRQLGRALKLLPEDDSSRRFRVHAQREEILRRLARPGEQLHEIQGMLQVARELDDPASLAQAQARLAGYYIESGDAASATRAAMPALRHAREAGDPLLEAEALRLRAAVAQLLGEGVEALAIIDSALALCDESPRGLEQRARVLTVRGTVLWHMGRLETAIESHAEALVIHHHLHEPRLEALALNNIGNIFAAMGEFEEALAHYKRSLKVNQRLGDRASIAFKLGNIGQTYAEVGDVTRAERYLRRALKLAEQLGDTLTEADAAVSLGQVALTKRDYERAATLCERGLRGAQRGENRYMEIRARIYLAMAWVEGGRDPEQALAMARTAVEQAERIPMPVGQTFGHVVEGLALAALGRVEEAAEASFKAVSLQSGIERPEGAEQILYLHATLCEAAARLGDARAALRLAAGEVEAKASKLRDPDLRALYLASAVPAAIAATRARLGSDTDE